MYIDWPVYGVYVDLSTSSLPEFTLGPFYILTRNMSG